MYNKDRFHVRGHTQTVAPHRQARAQHVRQLLPVKSVKQREDRTDNVSHTSKKKDHKKMGSYNSNTPKVIQARHCTRPSIFQMTAHYSTSRTNMHCIYHSRTRSNSPSVPWCSAAGKRCRQPIPRGICCRLGRSRIETW